MTITGNGYSYTVPTTMGLQSFRHPTALEGISIPGRDGWVINPQAMRHGPVEEIVLAGALVGSDATDLATKFKTLSEVINSSPEPLILSTDSRYIRVRKTNVSINRVPSGGKILRLIITFTSPDGYWQDNIPTQTDMGTFAAYPKSVLKSITISGSYKTYPTILWKPAATIQNPTVTWYGRNLVKNSSFVNGAGSWSGSAVRIEQYANKRVARVALNNEYYQYIPCNSSTTYYFSAYAASDTAATAQISVAWYNSSDVLLGTNNINYSATSTLTRFSNALSSLATAAYCTLTIRTTANDVYVYITDVQMEESVSLSEYMPSQEIQFKIIGTTTFSVDEVLEVDCGHKTVRHWYGTTPQWHNRIDVSNALFFHLIPGKNLLAFSAEDGGGSNNAQIFIRHIERYLGY